MTNAQSSPLPEIPHANELMTIQEAAALLRLPVATLRYWRHLGTGPRSFKIGRHVRYWHADLVLWLTEQTDRPQGQA